MVLLDDADIWAARARTDKISEILSESDERLLRSLSDEQLKRDIEKFFGSPVEQDPVTHDYGVIYLWYFASKWRDALKAAKQDAPIRLFEVAPGANDIIPKTAARFYTRPETVYITSNVDKKLTASFKDKTSGLPIKIKVIEDDAQNIEAHIKEPYFDAVAFEHSVNDVLYAMLGERAGVDLVNSFWFDVVQRLTDIITAEYENGSLEANAKPGFLNLIRTCLNILKPGGYIIINHFMYGNDLKRGINPQLWENLLPIVREWMSALTGGREVHMSGFNPQWWMLFQKENF